MKARLTLLITASILPAVLAVPAISSALTVDMPDQAAAVLVTTDTAAAPNIILASGDDDDDDGWFGFGRRGDDDDDDCEDDDDHGDDDDGENCVGAMAPAPAGSVAPPANGLFSTGAAPAVQVN